MTPALWSACEIAIHVVTPDGRVLRAGRAALYVLEHTGRPTAARLLSYSPFVWFAELAYWIVATHRGFFARILFTHEQDLLSP
jgi:hypothetical protein